MGVIVDLIIIAIVLLFIIVGYKKGLTGSLIKLLSFAIAVVLALILYKPVANTIIQRTQIDENLENAIITTFRSQENNQIKQEKKQSNMPETIVNNINTQIDEATAEAKNAIVENTAMKTTKTIINIGSGILIYIIVRFILFIISIFAKQITKLPIIKQMDKTGGIIYGILEGMVIVYILLSIISLLSVIWNDNIIIQAITKSTIGDMLYNNNIILKLLFK
jgi:uncharacterized membrane protein required for colicin V production